MLNYKPNPDAYFAQHALMRCAPFAPVLGNDHAIQPAMDPTGAVQALYAAWAPLLTAYAGGCWWLAAEPARVEAAAGLAPADVQLNAFTVGGGCTDVAAAGGAGAGPVSEVVVVAVAAAFASAPGAAVALSLADAFEGAAPAACASVAPGGGWEPLAPPQRSGAGGRWVFGAAVPLARGAAMVRCSRAGNA